jgi:hypothetical protein
VNCGGLVSGKQSRPPAHAHTDITNGEEGRDHDEKEKNNGAGPAHAQLKGITAQHAGFAHVRCKFCPGKILVNHVA